MSGVCLMRLANIVSDWLYMRPISIFGHCSDATFPIWIDGSTSCCCWSFFYFIFSSLFFWANKKNGYVELWGSISKTRWNLYVYFLLFEFNNYYHLLYFFSRARLIELNVSILVLSPGKYIPSNLVFVFLLVCL